MAALTNLVIAGARTQPIVLAVEDAHWADPSTLDLLRGIAERGALASLFVLITARPEFRAPWGVRSHHGTISLVPLDRQQVRDMVGGNCRSTCAVERSGRGRDRAYWRGAPVRRGIDASPNRAR
jgi:predicted ATPase